jgi:3-dehydroquinate synthase
MKKITLSPDRGAVQESSIIFIGQGLIKKLAELCDLKNYSRAFVITDDVVKPLWLEKLIAGLPVEIASMTLPSGEQAKQIDTVQKIWQAMLEAGCDRKSVVINLGGGVIGDMGGFAASTFMRGIDFFNVPTTLLAQVDASVGGKTGIDFAGIKNLIGTFNQPKASIMDTQTLTSLPERQLVAGFAEIIKHGLIRDKHYYEIVTAKRPQDFSDAELEEIIYGSCLIKAAIVDADAKEGDVRKLVNFGHTVGHAIEALSMETAKPLLHGEAISIGMVAEAKLSEALGMLSAAELARIEEGFRAAGLPIRFEKTEIATVRKKMQADKKNERGELKITLLKSIGEAVYNQTPAEDLVTQAIAYVLED